MKNDVRLPRQFDPPGHEYALSSVGCVGEEMYVGYLGIKINAPGRFAPGAYKYLPHITSVDSFIYRKQQIVNVC
jgi:hypothetical protein